LPQVKEEQRTVVEGPAVPGLSRAPMPHYHFIVHAFEEIDDPEGAEYPDESFALMAALKIVREIKRDEDDKVRGWSIEVKEGERRVAVIPFETVE
jgi:hypothetical protein